MEKKIIFSIIAIIAVLGVVFLSQKASVINQTKAYLAKGSEWAKASILPKISGEVQKRGDMIKNEVEQEKNKVSENISEKIKNYISGVTDSILHPGTPQNCPQPAEVQTPSAAPIQNSPYKTN